MAEEQETADKPGVLASLYQKAKAWLTANDRAELVNENDIGWGYDGVNVATLLGSGRRAARSRQQIMQKLQYMAGDPVISSALRLHVTAALGGHETSGDVVFLESAPQLAGKENPQIDKVLDELRQDILPIFNRIAAPVAFNACAFGDAYARPYLKKGIGLQDAYTDEMVYPPLVQAYEQGNRTVGFVVSTGVKFQEKLTIKQLVRCKLPRMLWVPQVRVLEKAARVALKTDDLDDLPAMPAMVGGSFLESAEEPYDNYQATLSGIIAQRITGAIDEVMVGTQMEGMTKDQQEDFRKSVKDMLLSSKKYAEENVKEGKIPIGRRYHLLPMFSEKQKLDMQPIQGSSGSNNIGVDDLLLHVKMLGGALGTDITMLGFADLLSGGLGDGGFFRVSAQGAERSRLIRNALTDFYHRLVDLHTMAKYGWVFEDGKRPYVINFYGSISALETEKQKNNEVAGNATTVLVQVLTQLRDLGMKENVNKEVLSKVMKLEEKLAETLAKGVKDAKPPADASMGGGFDAGPGGPAPLKEVQNDNELDESYKKD